MNRTPAQPSQTRTALRSTEAAPNSAQAALHPALARQVRWPAMVLSLLLTASVLAGADGLARHEARQAQALAASWAADSAPVAQAPAERPAAVLLVQARRSHGV